MTDEKLGPPAPMVLAMVLCDAIYQEPATKKCTLLGTFSTITARRFPVAHSQLAVHAALTDGRGNVRIKLALVGEEEGTPPLFAGEGVIHFADPRVVAELNFQLQNVNFPHPGAYRFQLFGNDQLLMERRLLVMQAGQAPAEPPPA
jgi:hypothetical protein